MSVDFFGFEDSSFADGSMTLKTTQAGQRDSGQSLFGQSSIHFFFVVQKIGMVFSNSVFLCIFFGFSNLPLCNFSAFSIFWVVGRSTVDPTRKTETQLSEMMTFVCNGLIG